MRTRAFPSSAMYRLPALSTARHCPDSRDVGVGDVEGSKAVHGHALGVAELSDRGRTVVAGGSIGTATHHSVDHTTRDLPNSVVIGVGNIEVPRSVYSDA